MVAAVVAIWLRNRDILRDVYDYSTLIGAAGKTEAGFRPYTEVRSPMQTSVYYFNWLSERIFGASYLGLSWGGLVQALLGGFLLSSLLWRRIGSLNAIWFAGAIMLAGCIQHMGFFYNPGGIVCFAVVVVGLARGGCLWPWRGAGRRDERRCGVGVQTGRLRGASFPEDSRVRPRAKVAPRRELRAGG